MLKRLQASNLALVESAQVEFEPGLNVITGETGAGKSLLIGALNLTLGERADRDGVMLTGAAVFIGGFRAGECRAGGNRIAAVR